MLINISNLIIKQQSKDKYLLGNTKTGKIYEIDSITLNVILEILRNKTEREIEQKFRDYDINAVISFLSEKQFTTNDKKKYLTGLIKFKWIDKLKPYSNILFWITLLTFISTLTFAIFLFPKSPIKASDLFITNGFLFIILFYVCWVPLTLLHELAHLIVANFFDSPGKIYFKIYFVFPALVTELPFVVFLNRNKRILVHSAGILMDSFLFAIFYITSYYIHPIMLVRFFRFLAIIKILSIIGETNIHLRTDIYFLIEDALNTINLKKDATTLLKKIFDFKHKIKGVKLNNPIGTVIIFLIIMVFGYFINLYTIIYYLGPEFINFYSTKIENRMLTVSFLVITLVYIIIKSQKRFKYWLLKKKA